MSKTNRKVRALNPHTNKIEEGVIISESSFRKTYDVKFNRGTHTVHKNSVQFLPVK